MDIPSMIVAAAERYGVEPALALEVATVESNLNPAAVSSAGAIGVMQLMPATAASLGVDPRDPSQNIDGGVHYLAEQLGRFSDVAQALAAYNWGPSRVAAAVSQFGANWLSAAPAETQNYVQRILGGLGTQYTVTVDQNAGVDSASAVVDAGDGSAMPAATRDPTGVWIVAGIAALAFFLWEDAWA